MLLVIDHHQVTGSHDKSLRLWRKTEEPLVLEEEQEMEREKKMEESASQQEEPVSMGGWGRNEGGGGESPSQEEEPVSMGGRGRNGKGGEECITGGATSEYGRTG